MHEPTTILTPCPRCGGVLLHFPAAACCRDCGHRIFYESLEEKKYRKDCEPGCGCGGWEEEKNGEDRS